MLLLINLLCAKVLQMALKISIACWMSCKIPDIFREVDLTWVDILYVVLFVCVIIKNITLFLYSQFFLVTSWGTQGTIVSIGNPPPPRMYGRAKYCKI